MRVLGIICEYNPFHNGHAYQIQKAREESGADALICVMSGHYTQRGEPAIVDKWMRTRMAIMSGELCGGGNQTPAGCRSRRSLLWV